MEEKFNRIKEVLARKGKTQKELSIALAKNYHAVSNWCINKAQPHVRDLYRIAEFLDVEVSELLEPRKKD